MKKKIFWMLFLAAYFAGYWAIFPGNFYYDDYHSIRNNTRLASLKNVPGFFSDPITFSARPRAAMYRPLLLVSYALDYQIYEWRVWGWHLTNLILHLVNALLVWILVRRTFKKDQLAWLACLIYAFHPVAGEVINYLNCRSSILFTVFILAGLISVSGLIESEGKARRGILWMILANLFFVLGLLSKESSATFPGIAFLYYWIFSSKEARQKLRGSADLVLPMLILLGGYLFLRQTFFDRIITGPFLPRPQLVNFFTELKSYFWYPGFFLWPRPSIEHSFATETSLWNFRVLLSLLGVLLLGLIVVFSLLRPRSRISVLGFLIGFYLLVLAPTSSIVPLNVLVSERAFYPALFALAILLALVVESAWKAGNRLALLVFGMVLINYLALISFRGRVWQDGYKLWVDAFRKAPDLARVAGEMGNEYARRGEEDKAVRFFMLSDQLASGQPATVYNLGAIYMDLGNLDLAEKYLEQAVELEPEDMMARVNLGVVYRALGKMELAKHQLESAIYLDPNSALAHNNLGDLYFSMGDLPALQKAEAEFLTALKLDPEMELAHYNLGQTYDRAGLYQGALEHFKKAYEQNPGAPDNSLWAGIMLIKLNQPKEAEDWIKKTLALDSKYGDAWYYLGLAKNSEGDREGAQKAFENALKLIRPSETELKAEIELLISNLKTP